jgi:hypothetical protein
MNCLDGAVAPIIANLSFMLMGSASASASNPLSETFVAGDQFCPGKNATCKAIAKCMTGAFVQFATHPLPPRLLLSSRPRVG